MKKLKLVMSIATMCLAIAVLCFGVLAATSVTYNVGGWITYDVKDVYVDVNTTVYKSPKIFSFPQQSELTNTLSDPANLNSAKTEYSLTETEYSDSFTTTATENPPAFENIALEFNKEAMTYVFLVNVKNLTEKNAWVVVDSKTTTSTNIQIVENYQLNISKDDVGKNLVIIVSIIDIKNSIRENTEFNFNLIFGMDEYVDSTTNMSKITIAEDNSVTKANDDISGVLVIPSSVTSIGSNAFSDCYYLLNVEIPSSVTSIGDDAFSYCEELTTITIPSSVTSIGYGAFHDCTGLKSATISEGITIIDSYTFYYCTSLISVSIPSSVIGIGSEAFQDCRSLTNITIPSSVKSIGEYAFQACLSLKSIEIPSGVTSIGDDAFDNCRELESITVSGTGGTYTAQDNCLIKGTELVLGCKNSIIPSGVTSIGYDAFDGCRGLTSITIPEGVTSIGGYAFAVCSSLKSINIPSSVTSIGGNAFYGCSSLANITIPSSVKSIGGDAFSDTPWLNNLTADSNGLKIVTSSDNENVKFLLGYTGSVATITAEMLSDVRVIYSEIFRNNKTLQSIEIPEGVTSIGSFSFDGCSSLRSITIPSSVTSIGWSAFDNTPWLNNLTTDSNGLKILTSSDNKNVKFLFGYTGSLTTITAEMLSGVRVIYDSVFEDNKTLQSITIPSSVTSIGYGAFDGCSKLNSVTFETGSLLTSIGSWAFRGCSSLISIDIPSSVTSIGNDAFTRCSGLNSVTFETGSLLTSIEYSAFNGCSSLTSITIPEGVTSIGGSAFSGCSNLTSITISGSVTSIGSWAFDECSSLTTINFNGIKEQWKAITCLNDVGIPTGVNIVCTDGTIVIA